MSQLCEHFERLVEVAPTSNVCDQCIAMGDRWVHLRACLECGQVGCCDNSKNRHARKHWQDAGHPLIKSIEPGETWRFCFADGAVAE
ncbi:MAG: UBP-type zinc finger domain-containing protein [Acidimicrobiia bacterium]